MTPRFASLALVLLSCSSEAHPLSDAGESPGRVDAGRDAGPDAGTDPKPSCKPGLEIREGDKALERKFERSSAEWTVSAEGEVFRLRLEASYDPVPEAVDDEYTYVVVIDIVPYQLFGANSFRVDQRVEVRYSTGDLADDPAVRVSPNRGRHDYGIRRALVYQAGFGIDPSEADYAITGKITTDYTAGAERVQGTLSLKLEGRVPHSFGDRTTLQVDGCFDVGVKLPAACQPGEECANDCADAEEWPCWACGTLYLTHDCHCRPDQRPLSECQNASPAGRGEHCGDFWWCGRECADGLRCAPEPVADDLDGGDGDSCWYYTCQ